MNLSYYSMPQKLIEAFSQFANYGVAGQMQDMWGTAMLLLQVVGLVVMLSAMNGIVKKHRYNQAHYGDKKLLQLAFGFILVNMNPVVGMVLEGLFHNSGGAFVGS